MAQLKKYTVASGETGQVEFDVSSFGTVLRRSLKDAVVMYEANKRQGTAKTKERGEIVSSQL